MTDKKQDDLQDVLQVQGRMTYGYGIIPKMAMQDRRLTPEAKTIYAYFCSFAGAGTTAFPSREKIIYDLQLGLKRYYKHFNLLKKYGYITVEQNINSTGKFKNNIYTLVEMIPCSQNDHTEPCSHFAYTQNDYTKKNTLKINNNNVLKKEINKVGVISHSHSHSQGKNEENNMTQTNNIIDKKEKASAIKPIRQYQQTEAPAKFSQIHYNTLKEKIQYQIEYEYFGHNDVQFVDNLIQIMLDVILTENPQIVKIGKEIKSRAIVKSVYLKLDSGHIQHILDQFKAQHHQITHKTAYLRTMLYNVYQEIDAHFTNQVRADGVVIT